MKRHRRLVAVVGLVVGCTAITGLVAASMVAGDMLMSSVTASVSGGDSWEAERVGVGYLGQPADEPWAEGDDAADEQWPGDADTVALAPELAMEATALWMSVQATQPPPPPRTGGGAQSEEPLPVVESGGQSARKIIKDAAMSIEVDSVALGLSRIDGIAAQSGGYVIATTTDYSDQFRKKAFIKIGVPVDQFEAALQRIREAAGQVLSEQASGVDVSQEYVDVQSQIANLEATQARVRELLDRAGTVEEALKVSARLSEIEGELSRLKGRLEYLKQRSAISTIAVELSEPEPEPTVTPTPTITPTPTATPTPTPRPAWQPGNTAGSALTALSMTLRSVGDFLIWFVLWLVPVLLLLCVPVAVLLLAARAVLRRNAPSDSTDTSPDEPMTPAD